MTKLLTEQEMRREIDQVLYAEHTQPYSTGDSLFNLFHAQKLAHGEMVIGDDEYTEFTLGPTINAINGVRNELRPEQRKRVA